jgi:hypothetical protein
MDWRTFGTAQHTAHLARPRNNLHTGPTSAGRSEEVQEPEGGRIDRSVICPSVRE